MRFFKPEIAKCEVEKCSFNKDKGCHAVSISIGGPHQECDTFVKGGKKNANGNNSSNVGICNVPDCGFNNNKLCQADTISVGTHENHADCVTFSKRA